MNSQLTKSEKGAIFAELKTEYLYFIIPFILLVLIKGKSSSWHEILLAPDWSLASAIVFGQITSKVSRAVAKCKTNEQHFGWYTAKRFFWVVLALYFYYEMLSTPSLNMGVAQLLVFIVASYLHFSDGFATAILQRRV